LNEDSYTNSGGDIHTGFSMWGWYKNLHF